MWNPIIVSDEDEDEELKKTPLPSLSKKPRIQIPTILIEDDPTPQKPTQTPISHVSIVPETPMSDVSIVKFTPATSFPPPTVSSIDGLICLESDNDEAEFEEMRWNSGLFHSIDSLGDDGVLRMSEDGFSQPNFPECDFDQDIEGVDKENFCTEQMDNINKGKGRSKVDSHKNITEKAVGKKKMTKEERNCVMEEKKQKKEQEKLERAALKAQEAELRKLEREKQKWEKGKFALKSIVAEFDKKVVEQASVGGHLLTRFADKGLTYRITSNPIEKSIVWTMSIPEHLSQISSEETEVHYVLLIYGAEEFCNLVMNESLLDHVSRVQSHYPFHTVCYLTNRLMAYINKREKEQYKNLENEIGWKRPPIEEVLAKLTTHYFRVHYRHCTDEAEVAEHVVGLTSSLASCQFRKKLTRLSVNANGSLVSKDFIDKNLIKKNTWLKALVAIPKVQPRFAVAIWKKYPTMKSLLSVYMNPSKSVHEKECLLEDLTVEGLLSGERRVGRVCSKRVYRILMAQSGSIKTDDVEDGADFFGHQTS